MVLSFHCLHAVMYRFNVFCVSLLISLIVQPPHNVSLCNAGNKVQEPTVTLRHNYIELLLPLVRLFCLESVGFGFVIRVFVHSYVLF